jgi:hypothetical protein
MSAQSVLATAALLLIVGVPFWLAAKPFKNPKQRLRDDNSGME